MAEKKSKKEKFKKLKDKEMLKTKSDGEDHRPPPPGGGYD